MNKYQEIIDISYALAESAHKGQYRKSGEPYFNHCKRVSDNIVGYLMEKVAILPKIANLGVDEILAIFQIVSINHDHLEDNPDHYHKYFLPFLWSGRDISAENYVIFHFVKEAIEAISKKPKGEELYSGYVKRVKDNYFAKITKLADLQDNLSDLAPGNLRDKYELTKWVLEN